MWARTGFGFASWSDLGTRENEQLLSRDRSALLERADFDSQRRCTKDRIVEEFRTAASRQLRVYPFQWGSGVVEPTS